MSALMQTNICDVKLYKLIQMIQRCGSFSCFALERPYNVSYSLQKHEIIELYCANGDIYQFRLPDYENYQKIVNQQNIKEMRRVGDVRIILDAQHKLIVRNTSEQLYRFDDIEQIDQWNTEDYHIIIGRHLSKGKNLIIGFISRFNIPKSSKKQIIFKSYSLVECLLQDQNHSQLSNINQPFPPEQNIQKIFGNCCIISDKYNKKIVIKIQFQKINPYSDLTIVKFCRIDLELPDSFQIISTYENNLLVKEQKLCYLIDVSSLKTLNIKEINCENNYLEFMKIQQFIIVLANMQFTIYESINGTLMAQILISSLVQESQDELSLGLQQKNEEPRYCLVFDKLNSQPTNFYLMDKEKNSIYSINIKCMMNEIIYQPIKQSLTFINEDSVHDNVIKTINFRTKKVQTLQKYISEGVPNHFFGNVIRFLVNQQNIFVLNDSITLFYNFINQHLQKSREQSSVLIQIEREFIKLCSKLIKQSKYENHIQNGLFILNSIFTKFRNNQSAHGLQKNKQAYAKILQSNRIVKLLKQDKKKRLFQLSYELAIKIKGFKYIQELSSTNQK